MSVPAAKPLDLDAFLAFADGKEGKWELINGEPVAMSPERIRRSSIKGRAFLALDRAVRRAGLRCEAFTEGPTIRISDNRAYVPDALVVCPPPPPDAVTIDNPLIVVEVLSPATAAIDHGLKLEGYFSLPSLAHYLILDADRRVAIHHKRGQGGVIETRILSDGPLRLDPPGLDMTVEELFGPADEAPPSES